MKKISGNIKEKLLTLLLLCDILYIERWLGVNEQKVLEKLFDELVDYYQCSIFALDLETKEEYEIEIAQALAEVAILKSEVGIYHV